MFAGLTSTLDRILFFGHDGPAERDLYANFLDEASVLLNRPALKDSAAKFRVCATAWGEFANALLPDDIPPFKETRELMLRRQRMFVDQGGAALAEIRAINARLDAIKQMVVADFPLDSGGVSALLESLRGHILKIHDLEYEAVWRSRRRWGDGN